MSDWSLRLAKPEDAEFLPAIEQAAAGLFRKAEGLAAVADMAPLTADQQRRYIARGHCLVAEAAGELVGFIATEPMGRELHVREMSVRPDWQGRGIGTIMLRALEIDARNVGFAALALTTFRDVPWNAPFYSRLGFVEVADASSHRHLADALRREIESGMPAKYRIAMIKFLA